MFCISLLLVGRYRGGYVQCFKKDIQLKQYKWTRPQPSPYRRCWEHSILWRPMPPKNGKRESFFLKGTCTWTPCSWMNANVQKQSLRSFGTFSKHSQFLQWKQCFHKSIHQNWLVCPTRARCHVLPFLHNRDSRLGGTTSMIQESKLDWCAEYENTLKNILLSYFVSIKATVT